MQRRRGAERCSRSPLPRCNAVSLRLIARFSRILSYGEFYDVPRIFVVTLPDGFLVFESPFNEAIDDYEPEYSVY